MIYPGWFKKLIDLKNTAIGLIKLPEYEGKTIKCSDFSFSQFWHLHNSNHDR